MEGRGHADHRGGGADLGPHGVLGLIDVSIHRRQGSVIPDGARQHIGNVVLLTGIEDPVPDVLRFQECRDGAVEAHPVDGVQVVVVAVWLDFLGVDVLAQGGFEIGSLQVMGGQGVARQHGVDIAAGNQAGKGVSGIVVKGKGGAHHPDHLAVVPLMAQQFVEFVIVPGKGGLPGPALPEGKSLSRGPGFPEPVRVDQNPVPAVLRPAHRHQIPLP